MNSFLKRITKGQPTKDRVKAESVWLGLRKKAATDTVLRHEGNLGVHGRTALAYLRKSKTASVSMAGSDTPSPNQPSSESTSC